MFDLTGKTALVTGGSRGIGRAVCEDLARAGAHVVVNYRINIEAAEATVTDIRKSGGTAEHIQADVSDTDSIENMFNRIKAEHGKLDILVNNAGVLSRYPFLELPVKEWDRIMNTNVRGYFYCGQQAARMMVTRRWGRIINISSVSQLTAGVNRSHYCASKGAIGMLTKGMALELAPYNITVNALGPGSIHTDFTEDVLSDPVFYQNLCRKIPAGRIGKPGDISGAAVYLSSEEAAFVNGAFLVIDGAMIV